MHTRTVVSFLILALLVRGEAAAADAAPEASPTTLAEYLAVARAINPDLAAAAADAHAAREHVGVAKGYPDPSLLYGYHLAAPDFHDESMDGRSELILMQGVPFPGKRGLRGEVASRRAQSAAHGFQATALDLDFEVKTAFYEFVRAVEVESVLVHERRLLVGMRDVARAREAAGTVPQQDVLKLDLAIANLDNEISMVEHQDDRVRARLNQLLGRAAHEPLPKPSWRVPVADTEAAALADTALARRPEMAAARTDLEAAEASRRLAKREYWPDLMVGAKWEFGTDMADAWQVMAGLELPVWLGKRRAMAREADAMGEAARHRLRAQSLRVHREVEDAAHGVRSARERLTRFEERILPRAEQAFQSSEAGYRVGRVEFIDYIDSQRMLLAMRREYFDAVAELGKEVAALERAVAATERHP